VAADAGIDEVIDLARTTGHTRFPVFIDERTEFFGVVHMADMLRAEQRSPGSRVREAMHEPLVVPDSLRLDVLLRRMSEARTHFAVVLDEYGSTEGVITRDDVVAELVGDIADEHRAPEVQKSGGSYQVPGSIHIAELDRATGLHLPPGEYETLGGFIMHRLGRFATPGDEIDVGGWHLRVLKVRRRRILSVDLTPSESKATD
jgi:CBS domain containing-hemolysin-like protein